MPDLRHMTHAVPAAPDATGGSRPANRTDHLEPLMRSRDEQEQLVFGVLDAVRAAQNGRPIPPHVERQWRSDARKTAKAEGLRRLRLELGLPENNAFKENSK
ncbi:hypothetical protein AB0387_25930 [Streptomyces sp. NPDC089173]|uniref:hypothetical protein n=1 Tax=Streptomyces sp. NPDC089173 TaxID=3154965 RepID=UPI00345103E6